MITIRNAETGARALTVRAGEDLIRGQIVKIVEGQYAGGPPQVVVCEASDLTDDTVEKGVVDFIVDNAYAVEWETDLSNYSLALNEGPDNTHKIPQGAQCVIWVDMPQVGYHFVAVDESLDSSTIREGSGKIAFNTVTKKICLFDDGGEDGTEVYLGYVYRHEGPEITVQFTAF